MIKKIVYCKKDGSISEREILVLEEDEGHYYALDKGYFSEDDWNAIQSALKDRPVVEKTKEYRVIEGFESSWFKGYRCFLKSSILPEQEEEQKEEE